MSAESGRLTPQARAKLAVLADVRSKWGHLSALVEQATARKSGLFACNPRGDRTGDVDALRRLVAQVGRLARETQQLLAERGFSRIADAVSEITTLAHRGGGAPLATLHRMREVVGQVYTELDLADRDVQEGTRPTADDPPT